MKYILEIKPEYEDSFKGLMILGAKDSNLFVDTLAVEDLEELNSDYINEHFSDQQDTAYQRGFERGKDVRSKGCEGCMYQDTTIEHNPCNLCCNAFLNRWTAKADKIGAGDVVKTYNGITFVVTKATIDGIVVGFNGEGNTCRFALSEVTKTGKHYNINEILGGLSDD